MRKLKLEECPKTRNAFVRKFQSDRQFRINAQYTGFRVICGNVFMPNGTVASATLK